MYRFQSFKLIPVLAISRCIGNRSFNSPAIGVVSILKSGNVGFLSPLFETSNAGSLMSSASSNVSRKAIHCGVFAFPAGVVHPSNSHIVLANSVLDLSLIHISEPTRLGMCSYGVLGL